MSLTAWLGITVYLTRTKYSRFNGECQPPNNNQALAHHTKLYNIRLSGECSSHQPSMISGQNFCKYVSHLKSLQYSHLSCDNSILLVEELLIHWLGLTSANCQLLWWNGRGLIMKEFVIDIPSRLKCYGEISWSVSRLSFSLITSWSLPSLYEYLEWENIT